MQLLNKINGFGNEEKRTNGFCRGEGEGVNYLLFNRVLIMRLFEKQFCKRDHFILKKKNTF